MGAKRSCRSPDGGGVPLLCFIALISGHSLLSSCSLPFLLPSCQIFRRTGQIFGKKGQKLDFLWCGLVFSRENRRRQRAKFKIYFNFEGCRASGVALSLGRWSCPLGAGGRLFVDCPRSGRVFPPFVVRFLPFVRLSTLCLSCCLQIWLYFAF